MYSFGGKDYKYRTFFESYARTIPPIDKEKQKLAIASLSGLTNIFDENCLEKIKNNPDLLLIASNLILADAENLNGDCVLKEDLIEAAENFKSKFFDFEHDRTKCLGVIDEIGWSLFPSNEVISNEVVAQETNPVQLVVGGYLWRIVDPELCELVELASNENSPNYLAISTSFELLFNDYWICVSPNKNAKDANARFIKPEDVDFEEFSKILCANGGDGKANGMRVFRVLKNDILPAGAGIVRNPASGIKGIATLNQVKTVIEEKAGIAETTQENESIKEINIILQEASVNENKYQLKIPMVIKSLQDLETHYGDFTKLEAKTAVASINSFLEEKVKEASEKYATDMKLKEDAAAAAAKDKAELEARATNLGKAVEELQAKLLEVESKQNAAATEQKFNERMASLDDVFDLEDDERAILVEEIREIKTDEVFANFMDKKKKLMKEKTKTFKSEKAKKLKEDMAKAGVTVTIDEKTLDFKEVLASVRPNTEEAKIPNTPVITEDLREKYAKAFASDVNVEGVKRK